MANKKFKILHLIIFFISISNALCGSQKSNVSYIQNSAYNRSQQDTTTIQPTLSKAQEKNASLSSSIQKSHVTHVQHTLTFKTQKSKRNSEKTQPQTETNFTQKKNFKIGLLIPWVPSNEFSGYTSASAVTMAIEVVNSDPYFNNNGAINLR